MTPRYLLDTNILSEPRRPHPSPTVMAKLREHQEALATASIVWHELLFGIERLPRSRRKDALRRYLLEVIHPTLPILPYDERAAAWHAKARADLARKGITPPFADGQIAATAAVNNLVLVTQNQKDYAHFEGLEVEAW